MYTVTKYPHGTFCWADNVSTDSEAAKPFYMDLFGWEIDEMPVGGGMSYTMFKQDGAYTAALSGMRPDLQAQGIPSHWSCYVAVEDVDALMEVVTENGGSIIVEPMEVFESGRLAFIQDPTGAQLGLWQARNHIGAGIVNTAGAMCWNELVTADAATARAFYSALFSWEYEGDDHYIQIRNGGRSNGGIIQMDTMIPCWMVYYHVADIDAGIQRVTELGGAITVGKHEIPGGGWWSVVADPAGAHFYIIQVLKPDPWVE